MTLTPLIDGPREFANGMTVRDLKELVRDWPEVDIHGELTEVWIGHDGVSNQVHVATELGDASLILDPRP